MEHLVQSDDVRPEVTDPHSQDWFVVAVGVGKQMAGERGCERYRARQVETVHHQLPEGGVDPSQGHNAVSVEVVEELPDHTGRKLGESDFGVHFYHFMALRHFHIHII